MLRGPRGSTSHALDDTGTAGPMLCSWEDCDPPVGETLRGTSWHVKTPLAFWLHILVWLEPIHLPVVRNICDFPQVMSGLCHFTIQCSMAMTLLSTVIRLSQFEFLVPPLTTMSFPQAFSTFQLSTFFHLQDLDLICTSSMPKQIIEHTPPPSCKSKPDVPNALPPEGKSMVVEGRGSVHAQIWWCLSSTCFWYAHKPASILLRQQYL